MRMAKTLGKFLRGIIGKLAAVIIEAVQSAIVWVISFLLSGATLLATSVYLLCGLPWALLAGAVCCFAFAFLLLLGMSRGQ